MPWGLDPIDIKFRRVHIRTLTAREVPTVSESIRDEDGWYSKRWGVRSIKDCENELNQALELYYKGWVHPFYYTVDENVAGVARLKRLDAPHRTLEIGGTWLVPRWRKSFVNTEVKLAMLNYCFEDLNAVRVEFRVDQDNIASQQAVLRIGGKFEGEMRSRITLPDGTTRGCMLYSIIKPEWPEVKRNLIGILDTPGAPPAEFSETVPIRRRKYPNWISRFGLST